MTVLSAWQNALSTTNPVGTRLERRSAGCMALILPMGAPRESQTASKLSQSQNCTPNDIETLEDALSRHGKPDIFNTDQGSQFTGAAFTGVLARFAGS
jgi:hypothetical protein